MKKILRLCFTSLKWLVLFAVTLEVFSFLVVTAGNYLVYGHYYEGSRVRYDPYALFLSVEGPRPTANNPAGPGGPDRCIVWMLGGSTMRGSTDFDDRTIPSYTAALLNRPGGPFPCTVMNYGENSFNSLIETKYLQKLLIESPSPPGLVVFYDGANDCSYFAQHRTPFGHYGYRRLRAAIENYRNSLFGLLKPLNAAVYASFTKELYDKLMQVVVPLDPDDPELKAMVDLTERRYDHVRKLAESYGAGFLLIWQPFLWVETGDVDPRVREQEEKLNIQGARFLAVRKNFTVVNRALKERLRGKPYFVDFQDILVSRRQLVFKSDGVHLQDAGREMVAGELARLLEARRSSLFTASSRSE